jgi:hypothetical protein
MARTNAQTEITVITVMTKTPKPITTKSTLPSYRDPADRETDLTLCDAFEIRLDLRYLQNFDDARAR